MPLDLLLEGVAWPLDSLLPARWAAALPPPGRHARGPGDLDGVSGLHPLRGDRAGFWAVTVSRNWRVVFRFDAAGDACDVDLEDYH